VSKLTLAEKFEENMADFHKFGGRSKKHAKKWENPLSLVSRFQKAQDDFSCKGCQYKKCIQIG